MIVEDVPDMPSVRDLERMGLFKLLDVETGLRVTEREPTGRFIPLRTIKTSAELSDFVVDLVPLFHTEPQQAEPVQYVMAELVRNTIEHSGHQPRAVVMAQMFPKSGTVGIGVADTGQGFRESLQPAYTPSNDLHAIHLALRPGVTGTTSRIGGTAENAAAGLFFCKSLAFISGTYFVIQSGDAFFKLRVKREHDPNVINVNPEQDRATRHPSIPTWPGTLVGLDLGVDVYKTFAAFMKQIRDTYQIDVKVQKKAKFKKRAQFR